MKFIILSFLSLAFLIGCKPEDHREGVVIVNTSFVDASDRSATLPPFQIAFKIIFKGKLSIQEVPIINFHKDSTGEKSFLTIKHYSYLDPGKNICLNYKTFSDTAKVWAHYLDIDSVKAGGGWNFFSNTKFDYDSSANLSDTIVNGTTYSRSRLYDRRKKDLIYFDIYTDCNRKTALITISKPLSDSLGCAVVRQETYVNGKIFMTRQLKFASDHLSSGERRVLEAWEKNAKGVHR